MWMYLSCIKQITIFFERYVMAFCLYCDRTVTKDRKVVCQRDGEGSGNDLLSDSNPDLPQIYGMVPSEPQHDSDNNNV